MTQFHSHDAFWKAKAAETARAIHRLLHEMLQADDPEAAGGFWALAEAETMFLVLCLDMMGREPPE